jgi:hypothetical protein
MELTMPIGFAEVSYSEKEDNNGGDFPWGEIATALVAVAVAYPVITTVVIGGAAYGCWCAGQEVGEAVGEFIYNCSH